MSSAKKDVVSAPMSFSGSMSRTLNVAWRGKTPLFKWLVGWWTVTLLVGMWWMAILMWYMFFGLFLVPFRLLRRGARIRKIQERQHREMLEAIRQQGAGKN